MQWADIPFHPPSKLLRQFAGLCFTFFGGLAVWHGTVSGRGTLAMIFAALALAIGPPGLLWPPLIRPIYVGWMVLAFPVGWTVSQALLAIMFFGLFTPISLLFRAMGRDPLQRARRLSRESYWSPKPSVTDPRRYFKQF